MTKKNYPEANQNLDFAKMEEEILRFWQQEKIFEKSVEIRNFAGEEVEDNVSPVLSACALKDHAACRHSHAEKSEFVFYDGPPFANGLPHYGHLLTGFIKDLVARYQTMKGKKVERKFGWDTHGLPVEMENEKELGVSGQLAIQAFGIEKFNAACEKSVMKYAGDWENYVTRQGRFVDFKNSYKTMDLSYMESVLWAFKQLHEKGLLYEDFRVVPYSWACQTPLSNFETRMDNSYRQKASKAVTVKFELEDESAKRLLSRMGFVTQSARSAQEHEHGDGVTNPIPQPSRVSLVAWTTTPWTLPSNLGLAVGKNINYGIVTNENDEILITAISASAEESFSSNSPDPSIFTTLPGEPRLHKVIKGSELIGLNYKPLFPYFSDHEKTKNNPKVFSILHGDFVTTEEGTGIVHMAPGFGEDDQLLCKANGIPTLCPVDEGGKFTAEIFDLGVTPSPLRGEGWGEGEKNLDLTDLSKNLRKNQTEAESKLWNILRSRQIENFKFRRQQQIGNYIADFVCLEKKLIVELDGGQHAEEKNISKDQERTRFLEQEGFRVLRFWNEEVFKNTDGVCDAIWNELNHPHPTLSPQGRGLEPSLSLKSRQVFDTNDDIIRYLKSTGAWLKTEQYLHNYPHCWRTDTPLIYKAVSSWYVKVTDIKDRMVELNQGINWIPNHIKDGQFGKWLEGARDWSITRNRFWGCPVPVWKSESGKLKVFGSIAELEKISGKKITNLHRPFIDEITFEENGEKFKRVTDVLDCWFESGSMPYAQVHYPFENKEWFEQNFPADFITEYVAQTRGWFYTLMVLSTALFDRAPFKNVICHGTILDEKSQKLSKRLKNYADPLEIFSTFGSDAMRFYMISQPVMRGQELRIDKEGKAIRDTLRLSIKPLINAFNFFCLYANADGILAKRIVGEGSPYLGGSSRRVSATKGVHNTLDRYILAKLKSAVTKIDSAMENYDTVIACEEFVQFFEALNNWYIRRNRQRFWKKAEVSANGEISDEDKQNAYDVLYTVLVTMCEAAAPLLPFTAEFVWRGLTSFEKGGGLAKARSEDFLVAS